MTKNARHHFSLSSRLVVMLLLGIAFAPFWVAEHFYLAPWSDGLYLAGYIGLLISGAAIGAVIGRGFNEERGNSVLRCSIIGAISLLVIGFLAIQIITFLIVFHGVRNI
jgi:hypothetical protein